MLFRRLMILADEYNNMGFAVKKQMEDLLDDDQAEFNPNAGKMILRFVKKAQTLGVKGPEIDALISTLTERLPK